jgi:hypothetical protein
MKIVILQSNYIPWKGYFELIHEADTFCFYDEVQYTKNDWRNRNKLIGPNGLFWLTVPVEKNAVKNRISNATIIPNDWQVKHFRTIEQTYSKSINKNEVLDLLSPIYNDHQWSKISELNQELIITISKYIGIKTNFENSKNFELKTDRVERLISLIKQLGGTEYISGPSAIDYISEKKALFSENNIEITYKDYGPYTPYENKRRKFENYVSILDLIMNVKQEDCLNYIKSNR